MTHRDLFRLQLLVWLGLSLTPSNAARAQTNLLSHYAFEGDARDSAGARDGTAVGSPSYIPGALGRAISLDGADDYVTLPASVAATSDITIAVWVYWRGGGGWQRIFDLGHGTDQYMFLSPSSGNGTARFAIKRSGPEQILDTAELPRDRWVHVALTLEADTGVLYVDGQSRVSGAITLDPSQLDAATSFLGESQYAADPPFNGALDDLRIYDYALDAAAIGKLFAPASGELVVHLPFDETSGEVAPDVSGNRFDGTLLGGATWERGVRARAVSLDGDDDAVRLPTGVLSGLQDFTLETWLYVDRLTDDARLFDFGVSADVHMYLTPRASDGAARFSITTRGSDGEQTIRATEALPTGRWTHVAVTRAGQLGALYVDGEEVGRNTELSLGPVALGQTTRNFLGAGPDGDHHLAARLDELKIHRRALTAAELSAAYGGGAGATEGESEQDAGTGDPPPTSPRDAGVAPIRPDAGTAPADAGSNEADASVARPRVVPRNTAGCSSVGEHPRGHALAAYMVAFALVLGGVRRRRPSR